MLAAALWTVMTHVLLRSALGLAIVSALLTVLMFRLDAPLAGVFELSVCTGLISVIFISTISLTQRLPYPEYVARRKKRYRRFLALPLLLVVVGVILILMHNRQPSTTLPSPLSHLTAAGVLWDSRKMDLLGQILILLAGVYGVVILFKEAVRVRQTGEHETGEGKTGEREEK